MSLAPLYYDPFTHFDRLFDDAFTLRLHRAPAATQLSDTFRPRMDIQESKDTNTVTATFELPGMQADDVTIHVQQDRLTVAGETKKEDARDEDGYTVRERRYGAFSRTLELPLGTKPEDVKAKMENGILAVTFPKTTPEQEPRRISIQ